MRETRRQTSTPDHTVAMPAEPVIARATPSRPPPPLVATTPTNFADLGTLVLHLGTSTETEAHTLIGAIATDVLAEEGSRVATPRITDDALRIYGEATRFFEGGGSLVDLVRLSPAVVRCGAWAAHQGECAQAAVARGKATRKTQRRAATVVRAQSIPRTRAIRDQLEATLAQVAVGDSATLSAIKTAVQREAHGLDDVGAGAAITALVGIGRALLASDDAGVKARSASARLTAAWLDACEAEGTTATAVQREAEAPVSHGDGAQRAVDCWDGLNLRLLTLVVDAFAKARALDARVPKLAFVSLRSYFARKPAKPVPPVDGGGAAPVRPS